jgi:hypothetical protein
MFAISLTIVVLFSTGVLLYQYWRGSLAARDAEATLKPLRPAQREHAPPTARAA